MTSLRADAPGQALVLPPILIEAAADIGKERGDRSLQHIQVGPAQATFHLV